MKLWKRWSLRHFGYAQELKWWLYQVLSVMLLILNSCMDGMGTYQFKVKTPNNSPPQISHAKKCKPIVIPIAKMDFVDSSTQFEDNEVNIESELKYTSSLDQPISSID